ncbi:unnamed protein product [Gordionus sp. m RMFG-2023]
MPSSPPTLPKDISYPQNDCALRLETTLGTNSTSSALNDHIYFPLTFPPKSSPDILGSSGVLNKTSNIVETSLNVAKDAYLESENQHFTPQVNICRQNSETSFVQSISDFYKSELIPHYNEKIDRKSLFKQGYDDSLVEPLQSARGIHNNPIYNLFSMQNLYFYDNHLDY